MSTPTRDKGPDLSRWPYWPMETARVSKRLVRLTKPWTYITDSGFHIELPLGFVWDGATKPRLSWLFIGTPWDDAEESAIHDWLCDLIARRRLWVALPGLAEYLGVEPDYSRRSLRAAWEWGAAIYRDCLRDTGTSFANRIWQYHFVRRFGWWKRLFGLM